MKKKRARVACASYGRIEEKKKQNEVMSEERAEWRGTRWGRADEGEKKRRRRFIPVYNCQWYASRLIHGTIIFLYRGLTIAAVVIYLALYYLYIFGSFRNEKTSFVTNMIKVTWICVVIAVRLQFTQQLNNLIPLTNFSTLLKAQLRPSSNIRSNNFLRFTKKLGTQ